MRNYRTKAIWRALFLMGLLLSSMAQARTRTGLAPRRTPHQPARAKFVWELDALSNSERPYLIDGMWLIVAWNTPKPAVFDLSTGRLLWQKQEKPHGRFYLDEHSHMVVVTDRDEVTAYSVKSGALLWRVSAPCKLLGLDPLEAIVLGYCQGEPSAPCGDSAALIALDAATGTLLWRHTPEEEVAALQINNDVLFYTDWRRRTLGVPRKGRLAALDTRSGQTKWRATIDDVDGSLYVSGDTLVVAGSDLTGYSAQGGQRLWRRSLKGPGGDQASILVSNPKRQGSFWVRTKAGYERYLAQSGSLVEAIPYPPVCRLNNARRGASLSITEFGLLGGCEGSAPYLFERGAWTPVGGIVEGDDWAFLAGRHLRVLRDRMFQVYRLDRGAD